MTFNENQNVCELPFDKWDSLHNDYWELVPSPNYFRLEEAGVINAILQKMGIYPEADQLIELRARLSDMNHLIVQVIRTLKSIYY
jgi:hypothetical protein